MNKQLTRYIHPNIYNWLSDNKDSLPGDHATMLIHTEAALESVAKFRHELRRVEIYYAYKCFSNLKMVEAIDEHIDGYDIASENEFRALMSIGVKPERMLFANPVKIPSQIEYTYNQGVEGYTFQSKTEVEKIAKLAPGSTVIIRMKVPDENNITGQAFSKKFGAEPGVCDELIEYAKELGLNPVGMAFHVGSQSSLPELWTVAIRIAADLIDECSKKGINLSVVDIGGGWPAPYETGKHTEFEAIAQAVRQALTDYIPKHIRVIAEPGRILAANTAAIITTVIGRETRGLQEWLFLDTGVFQCMVEVLEFHRLLQKVMPLNQHEGETKAFTLAGPTCDSDDTIEQGVTLPANMNVGDKLVITQAGAYTLAYGSDFNGINRPEKLYI